jgi:hypothetical protein
MNPGMIMDMRKISNIKIRMKITQRIKKMTISNSKVRKELETLYKFQKAIHSAYEKTKNDSKFDYSKDVMAKIQNGYEYTTGYFYKIAALFVVLMLGIIAGFTYLNF